MNLESYRSEFLPILFDFWCKLGAGIPYFFAVSPERWQACLLADRLDSELIFKNLETYVVVEASRILGFVQFGQPNFAWNENGARYSDPATGVIRHLYFEREFPQAGRALLAQAEPFLERFPRRHAFYHILGMSCNAQHGKLHESQDHVEELLLEDGFQVEHENVYFVLDLKGSQAVEQTINSLSSSWKDSELEVGLVAASPVLERYEARLAGSLAGSAEIRFPEPGTGEHPDNAYLTWIGLVESQRGRGLGAGFLGAIVEGLKWRGCRTLHTDTASTNLAAQHFYAKFGFQNLGKTRSYFK